MHKQAVTDLVEEPKGRRWLRWGQSRRAQISVLAAAGLAYGLFWLGMNTAPVENSVAAQITTFTTIFLGLYIEAAPFLLLGTVASGLVEVFVNQDLISRWLPRDPLRGALAGALLGFCFPVCECGVVPLTRRLFRKGLPLSTGVAFLLAAPVINPIVIASTVAAFGIGRMLYLRLGLTLAIALIMGCLFAAQKRPELSLLPAAWRPMRGGSGLVASAEPTPTGRWYHKLHQVVGIAIDEFFEMGRYLIIGAALAAALQTFLPQNFLLALSSEPVLSVAALIGLAVVLSICSTVDAFIALAFAGTFSTGAILAFLVFGPMVDIKSTLMFLGLFRRRTVVYVVVLPLLMTLLVGIWLNFQTTW